MTAAARWYHTTTTTTAAAAAADASADVHISQQLAGQHRRPTCARMPPRASAPLHPAWMTIADDRATRYSAHRATTVRLGPHAVQRPRDGAHHSEQPDDGARIVMQSLPCALSNSRLVPRTLGTRPGAQLHRAMISGPMSAFVASPTNLQHQRCALAAHVLPPRHSLPPRCLEHDGCSSLRAKSTAHDEK
jgi:hypothetical protein